MTRVLLVEDEDNIAIAIELLLTALGHDVCRVKDGTQALPNIRASAPDCVIIDATLPGMSGYEVCQSLRLTSDLPQPPVLLMTARTHASEGRKAHAMGADAILTKPFAMSDLTGQITRLIAGGS